MKSSLLLLVLFAPQAFAQCAERLLVSGYFSDNVHVYDACNGSFERTLGMNGELDGAQASRIGPDGHLYVVAEEVDRIMRLDAGDLSVIGEAVRLPDGYGATGIEFHGNEIWVASYSGSKVGRFSLETGEFLGDALPSQAAGLLGADNGMVFGPDGMLYVPGFDSHSVIRHDPASGISSGFIASGSGGLFRTRGILFEPGGQSLLVTSEGSGQVLRYASDGRFLGVAIDGLSRPTGISYHPDGSLLVLHVPGVERYDATSYASLGLLASATEGRVFGPTFVSVVALDDDPPDVIDTSQIGNQFWLAGAGPLQDNVIEVEDMVTAVNGGFGGEFDPADIVRKRWGSLRIAFSSCTEAEFSWESTGPDSAGFGRGSYALHRLLTSAAVQRCLAQGFANSDSDEWVTGSWYGGPERDGEGLMIDLTDTGIAFVTWFSYRPAQP